MLAVLIVGAVIAVGVYSAFFSSGRTSETPEQRADINGVRCQQGEQLIYHWHTTLKLYEQSEEVKVPANIGIFPNCLYWLHTHDDSGKIHIESPIQRTYTLGNFLAIWGKKITNSEFLGQPVNSEKPLIIRVNNLPYQGDPEEIPLRDGELIVIAYGKPPP